LDFRHIINTAERIGHQETSRKIWKGLWKFDNRKSKFSPI